MKKVILTGLAATVMSASAIASDVTGYTAPESGQAATAAGVDANFQALITAINDNNDRIVALEDAAGTPSSLREKISGATYTISYMGAVIGTYADALSPYKGAYLEGFGGRSVLTFETDGTLTELYQESGREIDFENKECTESEPGNFNCEHWVEDFTDGPETFTGGSWELDGNILSVTFPEEDGVEEFIVALDGEILVLSSASFEIESDQFGTNDDYDHSLAIGVRTSEPAE
ncbi:hypothetical protein [Alcanivorax sp. NBRC 102028]|uniref:hypothetical protein n=1 Tax=Alcanivorax sp. NBRC 102028 TaxID=1113897 RepID=UPI000789D054|nr:hypothetical protein [Alcanivorax sp. NBRC 102028]